MSDGTATGPKINPAYTQWQATERAGRASYLAAVDQARAMLDHGMYPDHADYQAAERFAFQAYQAVSRQAWRDYQDAIGWANPTPPPWRMTGITVPLPGTGTFPVQSGAAAPTFTPANGDPR